MICDNFKSNEMYKKSFVQVLLLLRRSTHTPGREARLCFFNDANRGVKELHDVTVDAIYTG